MKKMMFVAAMVFAAGVYAADVKVDAAKVDAPKADMSADADKDGKITVVEYVTFYKLDEKAGKALDKNNDGLIAVDEIVVVAPAKEEKKDAAK